MGTSKQSKQISNGNGGEKGGVLLAERPSRLLHTYYITWHLKSLSSPSIKSSYLHVPSFLYPLACPHALPPQSSDDQAALLRLLLDLCRPSNLFPSLSLSTHTKLPLHTIRLDTGQREKPIELKGGGAMHMLL